jgi:biopolymer transport protein ExbD
MGGGSSGKGGVADANLNVVPFIDLLACTICFLLVSAVWSALARVDVDQALPKASKTPPKEPPKPEPKINVLVCPTGYKVNLWNADHLATPRAELTQPFPVPLLPGEDSVCRNGTADCEKFKKYDRAKLQAKLEEFRAASGLGDKVKVMVSAQDGIQYTHLIDTLDTVLGACEPKTQTNCVGPDGKKPVPCCLKNPSVGDSGLLRAEGLATLCD